MPRPNNQRLHLLEFNFRECETYPLMRSIYSFYTFFFCLEIHDLKYKRTFYILFFLTRWNLREYSNITCMHPETIGDLTTTPPDHWNVSCPEYSRLGSRYHHSRETGGPGSTISCTLTVKSLPGSHTRDPSAINLQRDVASLAPAPHIIQIPIS